MTEKKDSQKEFDTCLDTLPYAEMILKILGQNGIGSLCADIMKKMSDHQGKEAPCAGNEMLRSMIKEFYRNKT